MRWPLMSANVPARQAEMPAEYAVFELQGTGGRQGERLAEAAGETAIGQRVAAKGSRHSWASPG